MSKTLPEMTTKKPKIRNLQSLTRQGTCNFEVFACLQKMGKPQGLEMCHAMRYQNAFQKRSWKTFFRKFYKIVF